MNRIRTLTGLSAGMSLAVAAVAIAAPDREYAPSASAPTFEWDSAPMSGAILGVDSDRDNTLVKLPAGGNLTVKLTNFEDASGGADFDIRLYVANAEGDPEGDALAEAIEADNEQETLSVKNLKPGNYNVEVNAFATVEGTFHGTITASGPATAGSAPSGGGSPSSPSSPPPSGGSGGSGTSGGGGSAPAAPAATDATPDAKLGKLASKAFKGTATDDKGVAKVEVAVQRKRGAKCTQMTAKGRFVKQAKCDAPSKWLRAKGTTKWTYKLKKKLKKGGYTVFARATDNAGQKQAGFTPANKRAFKVK